MEVRGGQGRYNELFLLADYDHPGDAPGDRVR